MKKNVHNFCADDAGERCIPTPEDKKGDLVCVEGADCSPVPAFKRVRCIPDPNDDCKKTSEVYFVDCDGAEIPDACEVPCPPKVMASILGGGIAIEGPVTIAGPLDVNVLNTVTVDPSANFTALLEGLNTDLIAAFEAAIEAQTAAITADLQAICDKLADTLEFLQSGDLVVNAVQSGEWAVTINGEPLEVALSAENLAELAAAIAAAIGDLTLDVNIVGQDVAIDVNITNDPLIVSLDGETVTVVVDTSNGPVEVTGTVTLSGPVQIDWSNVPALDVNIVDSIALTIGELPPVVWDETQFNTLIDTINQQIRCDYEHVQGLCAFNAAGDKIPNVASFRQICYQGQTPVSNTQVWSQLQADGTWGPFVFADGATAGECAECPIPVVSECFVKYTRCVGYDNGVTPGSSTNDGGLRPGFVSYKWNFTVKGWLVNGTEVGANEPLGAYSGWTPQLQGWADFFNANMPASVLDAADDKAAFGFLPAPTWRYAKITTCDPTASFGPLRIEREDGVCFTIYPILESTSREYRSRVVTMDCAGKKTVEWCDQQGNPVEAPEDIECWFPCSVIPGPVIEGPDGPDCKIIGAPTKMCDKVGETTVEIVQLVVECDGDRSVEYYTAADWDAGEIENQYTPEGELVSCETGEPVEPLCDPNVSWSTQIGHYTDAEGNCKNVKWVEGINCAGAIVYPKGAKCPTYLDAENATALEQCVCLGRAKAATALGAATSATTTGAGTSTHTISFDPNVGLGIAADAALAAQVGGSANEIGSVTLGGQVFTYNPSTLTGSNGEYTSTLPVPENNCQDQLFAGNWPNQSADGTGTASSWSNGSASTSPQNCVPGEQECNKVLETQPALVKFGLCPADRDNATTDALLQQLLDALCGDKPCPEVPCQLVVGDAEFAGEEGGLVTFPLTSPPNTTADYMVPISLDASECLAALDPNTMVVVRWHFDHSIDASSSHTGFNVGGTDGTQAVGTVIGQSGGNPNVMVGPASTPHNGPRDDYWVDIEFTLGDLLNGVAVQTSAFGTVTTETETIHSQRLELLSGLENSGCC